MEKIFIARKRVKNLNIRITRDGEVHVTAPLRMSDADIESILDRKRGWIEKHRGQMLEKARLRPQNFESGETLRVLGKPFRLRVEESSTPGVAISGGEVVLTMRPGSTREQREAAIIEFYRVILTPIAEEYLALWQDRTGLRCREWHTKKMKTRWGSCNVAERRIWLSVYLAAEPREFISEVVLHELAHIKYPGHGVDFKAFMDLQRRIDVATDTHIAVARYRNC